MNSPDGDLVTVRKVDSFQSRVSFCKRVNGFIGKVMDSHESYTTELLQRRELENGHIRQLRTVYPSI